MKRGTRPFIVEVRRGQKRTPLTEGEEESNALRNEALRRAEKALFGTPSPAQPQAPEPKPPPEPEPRRILASLADAETSPTLGAEPEPAQRRRRKRGQGQARTPPGGRGKRRLADKTAARSIPLTPELVNAALDKIEKATLAVPQRRATEPSSVSQGYPAAMVGGAEKALDVRRKNTVSASRHAESKIKREPTKISRAPRTPRRTGKMPPPALQSSPTEPPKKPQALRPSIRGRYVFGTELKPGERWKRRLRRGR